MVTRSFVAVVLVFWLVAMGWLFSAKIWPLLVRGDVPDDREVLPAAGEAPRIELWQIRFEDRPVGWALTKVERGADGRAEMRSHVELEKLPIDRILSRVLGVLRTFLPSQPEERLGEIDMTFRNRVDVAPDGRLSGFETSVGAARVPDLVRIRGEVRGGKLHVRAGTRGGEEAPALDEGAALEQSFELEEQQLYLDGIAPRPRLAQLKLGQTWTFRSFAAFPPGAPAQVMQARVDRQDLLMWNAEPAIVFVVEIRDEGGAGLSTAREPLARLWVTESGEVLQTETALMGLRFRFVRQMSGSFDDKLPLVNAKEFP